MALGNGPRGLISIREPLLIWPSPRWVGRGTRLICYMISSRRNRNGGMESSTRFRDSGGTRMISIGGWKILGYGGIRRDNWSRPISKIFGADSSTSRGNWDSHIVIGRREEVERRSLETVPIGRGINIKHEIEGWDGGRVCTEVASWRHRGRQGGGWETSHRQGVPGSGHSTHAAVSSCVRRNRNESVLVSIIPPGVGTIIYWGVARRETRGRTEQGSLIN